MQLLAVVHASEGEVLDQDIVIRSRSVVTV